MKFIIPKLIYVAIFLIMMPFSYSQESSNNVRIEVLKGKDITPYSAEINNLALIVYREYPYFYEGTIEEYLPFIQYYSTSSQGITCLVWDQKKLAGVALGMPMKDMREKYRQPLLDFFSEKELESFFYLGEFLLLKEYRSKGLGTQLYLQLEQAVKEEKDLTTICLCKIIEPDEHPLIPENFKSSNIFWSHQGFKSFKEFSFPVLWRNINETNDSPHDMQYWMKNLN